MELEIMMKSHVSSQQFHKLIIEITYRHINEEIHDCTNNIVFVMQNNYARFINSFFLLISIMILNTDHDYDDADEQRGNIYHI